MNGGDSINCIFIYESKGEFSYILDKITEVLKNCPDCEIIHLEPEQMLSLPGLEVDLAHRKVYCGNHEINLTAKEYSLLYLLVVNEGYVLTYDQIYQKVWREEAFGSTNNAIKCHIRNLREANPDAPFSIRCVREVGYCFELITKGKVIT